jgi:hypothetical protein
LQPICISISGIWLIDLLSFVRRRTNGGTTEDAMKGVMIDATDVTRKALLGIDDRWYEAYWYIGGAETKLRLLARLAGRLAVTGRAICAGYVGRARPCSARARTASVPSAVI